MKNPILGFILFIALGNSLTCWAKEAAILMQVTEVSDQIGQVSTQAKRFRLDIDYKEDLFTELDDLNDSDSVFLKNLRIISRSLNRKKKNPKSVLDNYQFELESQSDSDLSGYKKVSYISNEQIIKKASRINFRIDVDEYLEDKFLDSSLYKTRAAQKYDIQALELSFDNLSSDQTSLNFIKTGASKKAKAQLNGLLLTTQVTSNQNLSNIIKESRFNFKSEIDKKIKPKIKIDNTRKGLGLKISNTGDAEVLFLGDNKYQISLALDLKSKKSLSNSQINKLSKFDTLIIPVLISGKTGDSLDIKISGILRQKIDITGEIQ